MKSLKHSDTYLNGDIGTIYHCCFMLKLKHALNSAHAKVLTPIIRTTTVFSLSILNPSLCDFI